MRVCQIAGRRQASTSIVSSDLMQKRWSTMRQEQSLNQILALSLHSFLSSDCQCKSSRAHSCNSLFMRMPAPALLWVRMTLTVWILACTTAGPFSGRRSHGRYYTFPCWPLMLHHIHPAKGLSEKYCPVFMSAGYTGMLVLHMLHMLHALV